MDETEPTPGVEPDHTAYEAGARPSRSMGRSARGSRVRGDAARTLRAPKSLRSSGQAILVPLQGTRIISPGACRACPSERGLQREESNLRGDRLTGGCLTIRLRWKRSARRGRGAKCSACAVEPSCAKFSESEGLRTRSCEALGSGHRIRTCVSGFRDQRPAS